MKKLLMPLLALLLLFSACSAEVTPGSSESPPVMTPTSAATDSHWTTTISPMVKPTPTPAETGSTGLTPTATPSAMPTSAMVFTRNPTIAGIDVWLKAIDVVNIRQSPDKGSDVLAKMQPGECVKATKLYDFPYWHKVVLPDGRAGYVYSWYLIPLYNKGQPQFAGEFGMKSQPEIEAAIEKDIWDHYCPDFYKAKFDYVLPLLLWQFQFGDTYFVSYYEVYPDIMFLGQGPQIVDSEWETFELGPNGYVGVGHNKAFQSIMEYYFSR